MDDDLKKLQKDPPEGSREVIERELERSDDEASESPGREDRPEPVPDAAGVGGMQSIPSIELSLHSDGINHWQDEPEGSPRPDVDGPTMIEQSTDDMAQDADGLSQSGRGSGLATEVGPAQPYDVDQAEGAQNLSAKPRSTGTKS
jgi:hypothetical protein